MEVRADSALVARSHPLYHARLKCDRAQTHLRTLKGNVRKYKNNPRPSHSIVEGSGGTRFVLRWPPAIPDVWGLILSDFATNLRASLDYITWQLATKHLADTGETRDPSRGTQFPIFDSADSYRDRGTVQVQDIMPSAVREIERMQPYNRTDWSEAHALSILRELSNKTKHRFIIPPSRTARITAPAGGGTTAIVMRLDQPRVVVHRSGSSPEPYSDLNPHVSIQVSFETPDISPSTHDIAVLDDIYELVSKEVLPRFARFF